MPKTFEGHFKKIVYFVQKYLLINLYYIEKGNFILNEKL